MDVEALKLDPLHTDKRKTRGINKMAVILPFFAFSQVSILNKEENKRDTIVDRVFRKALQEFHMQLISSYSVLMKVRLS